jgi:hypothetical protein
VPYAKNPLPATPEGTVRASLPGGKEPAVDGGDCRAGDIDEDGRANLATSVGGRFAILRGQGDGTLELAVLAIS